MEPYLIIWGVAIAYNIVYLIIRPKEQRTKIIASIKQTAAIHNSTFNSVIFIWIAALCVAAPLFAVFFLINDMVWPFVKKS